MSHRLDTGSNSNRSPFLKFKFYFPNQQIKLECSLKCKLKLIHNERQKICKFFVVPDSGTAVLGMPDIDKLGIISFNCETMHGQVAADDSADNSKCENPIQI